MTLLITPDTPIYVDPLMRCLPNPRWRWSESCHMFTDPGGDLDALHRFAESIGLRRSWFQQKPNSLPHYDLTPSKRKHALAQGATEIDRRATVEILRRWREGQAA